jgi:hypothetical protein
MTDANEIVIVALLDDVLDEGIVRDSVGEALRLLQGDGHFGRLNAIEIQIAKIDTERKRLERHCDGRAARMASRSSRGTREEAGRPRSRARFAALCEPSKGVRRESCAR